MLGLSRTCVAGVVCIHPSYEKEFKHAIISKRYGRSIESLCPMKHGIPKPPDDAVDSDNDRLQNMLTIIDEEHYLIFEVTLANYADILGYIAATGAYKRSIVKKYNEFSGDIAGSVKIDGDNIELFDMNYIILSVDVMQKIMEKSYLFAEQYVSDLFDCDDFAESFRSIVDNIFLCNSVGFAAGKLIDNNGNVVGLHAYNIVPAYDPKNDTVEVYIYEPQTNQYAPASNPVLNGLRYETMFAMFG